MFFVLSGEVEVERGDIHLGFLGKGSLFGEMTIIAAVAGSRGSSNCMRGRTVCTTSTAEFGNLLRPSMR